MKKQYNEEEMCNFFCYFSKSTYRIAYDTNAVSGTWRVMLVATGISKGFSRSVFSCTVAYLWRTKPRTASDTKAASCSTLM
jgi:hypothetical protein